MIKKILVYFVFLLLSVLFLGGAHIKAQTSTANLFFSPATVTLKQGDTVWINVMVNTGGQDVNAVGAYFTYPEDTLQALGVDKTGSVMTLVAEESAGSGIVQISGGKPTPGFNGIYKIAAVGFRAKASSGTATLTFRSDAAILRNSDNQNIINLTLSGPGTIAFQSAGVPVTPTPTPTPTPIPLPPPMPPPTPQVESLSFTDIKAERKEGNKVLISWKTNQKADSRIYYGVTSSYTFSFIDGESTTEHGVLLFDLEPEIDYNLQLGGKDSLHKISKTDNFLLSSILVDQMLPTPSLTIEPTPRFSISLPILFSALLAMVFLTVALIFVNRART